LENKCLNVLQIRHKFFANLLYNFHNICADKFRTSLFCNSEEEKGEVQRGDWLMAQNCKWLCQCRHYFKLFSRFLS